MGLFFCNVFSGGNDFLFVFEVIIDDAIDLPAIYFKEIKFLDNLLHFSIEFVLSVLTQFSKIRSILSKFGHLELLFTQQ